LTPVHKGGEVGWPRWSPDGQRIAFEALEQGRFVVRSASADRTGHSEVLAPGPFAPSSWLASGDLIGVTRNTLARVRLGKDVATVRPLDDAGAAANWPEISPDGRWLAYGSNAGGRWETYVQPYGVPGDRTQVSVDGGTDPAWNPSGHELFYVTYPDSMGNRRLMSVPFSAGAPPRIGAPRSLFQFKTDSFSFSCTPVRCYDVSPDGMRFYVFRAVAAGASPPVNQINLIQNWLDDLRAKVPSVK
jgi:dipeptidyl aminopeptidase/acylaminoacyl peptidase